MQNIFEYATRTKLRFPSIKGELSIEQLWDVPLRSRDDFNLDVIAKTANKALKETTEESFVETPKKTAEQTRRESVMEAVKYIIDTKVSEEKADAKRAENKKEKEKLLEILAEKQDGKLSKMSEEELKKRIKALED